ncbi:caspase-1 isoform X1 [Scaptodrosophila lebanonensis]|uniref:Caspase-1 isoform X1 n=1 Tax=Drosophila lebanonensis TaxID=7225 RepID=A0A6J2UM29_DROLE|nr:caspase-1 isoform X1 [Scaptodrosophila lebanonensis]
MTDECITKNIVLCFGNGKSNNSIGDKTDAQGCSENNKGGAVGGAVVASHPPQANKYVARMPVDRYASEYNMNHKNRGKALIFNHELFDIPSLKARSGTNVDCEELRKALKRLDFDVSVHKDCKFREILEHIEKAASHDHNDNDCIAIAILSHGEHGYIYAKDVQYKLDNIWHYFTAHNCPSLAGKPKMFFIQACQGDRLDAGVMLEKNVTETDGESSMSYKIPIHADFLFSYSTIPGYYSWRNTSNGSWYMQSLIQELNTNGKKYDMLTLLTFVSQRVAVDFESNVPSTPIMDRQKQIPCVTSMLTRILRFTDKNTGSKAG